VEERLHDHVEVIDAIGDFSKVSKLHSNYGEGLQKFFFVTTPEEEKSNAATAQFEPPTGVGFLHTHYFQDGTVSGRLSTREPPLHTIPKKSVIKELFSSRFPGGFILHADYAQAEVRAFVIETDDPDLRQAFRDGVDPHILTASKAFMVPMESVSGDQRQHSKAITFGLLFGRGEAAIAKQTGKPIEEMRKVKKDFLNSMPKVKGWIKHQHDFVDLHECVLSRLGRIRDLSDDIGSGDSLRKNHAHNVGVNHPIQGLVGDICTNSAARLDYRLGDENFLSVVFLTVHDSALVDLHPLEVLRVPGVVRSEMQDKLPRVFPFVNVPMDLGVEIGVNWRNLMEIKVVGSDTIVLNGPLSYLSGLHERLGETWQVSVENLSRFSDEEGKPMVEAALRLRVG
jgi:DNA polymerase-1